LTIGSFIDNINTLITRLLKSINSTLLSRGRSGQGGNRCGLIVKIMKNYELFCILPGTLAENEVQPILGQITKVITENNGIEISIESKGKSRLAYPMKHIRYGYFFLIYFQAESENVPKIQALLRLNRELLRAVILSYNAKTREKSRSIKSLADEFAPIDQIGGAEDERQGFYKHSDRQNYVKSVEKKAEEQIVKPATEPDKKEESTQQEEQVPADVQQPISEEKLQEAVAVKESDEKKTAKPSVKKKITVSMEEIDKKLDELLDKTLDNV
jgi:small subunit ribosomal protein S6